MRDPPAKEGLNLVVVNRRSFAWFQSVNMIEPLALGLMLAAYDCTAVREAKPFSADSEALAISL